MSKKAKRGRKGTWSEVCFGVILTFKKKEDDELLDIVNEYGAKKWSFISQQLAIGKSGKQCRERYFNHLNPEINREWWSEEEEILLIEKHEELGNKWSQISGMMCGRPSNMVKNHYNSTLKRLVERARKIEIKKRQKSVNDNGKVVAVDINVPCYISKENQTRTITVNINLPDECGSVKKKKKKRKKTKSLAVYGDKNIVTRSKTKKRNRNILKKEEEKEDTMIDATTQTKPLNNFSVNNFLPGTLPTWLNVNNPVINVYDVEIYLELVSGSKSKNERERVKIIPPRKKRKNL